MAVGNNINKPVIYEDKITGRKVTINPAAQGGYMNAYDQYAASKKQGLTDYEKQLNSTLAQNNATTNANYDNNARQAYVDYMRKQRALPSQLQALGVNGGATESGLLNLYNNYGASHAANEQQRAADLTANQQARDDAYNAYRRAYQEDLDAQYQTALNNQMNEYNNEITRFSSSVAQYPSTQKGYEKYKKWIENMKNSNDPLRDIKVALIRQQMASQFPDGKPESKPKGNGSSKKSYGGYSRYGGYGSNAENDNQNNNGGKTKGSPVTDLIAGALVSDTRRLAERNVRTLTNNRRPVVNRTPQNSYYK